MRKCLAAISNGMGFNEASKKFDIPKPSIRRYRSGLNKYSNLESKHRGAPCILPKDLEDELVQHMKQLDQCFFGITIADLKRLAYQIARAHGIKGFSDTKQAANKTWYYNFMRRHPELTLRSPEATSIGRLRGFNRQNVGEFFKLYCNILEEHNFSAERIYNMDETGHSTVQTPSKVISLKGKKQVGAVTSAERGTNSTGVYCHSATGHFIPPMIIFKRKRMAESLKQNAPVGTEFACSDSGWIDSQIFTQWLQHFIRSVKSSPENKHLLLLDGHTSHCKNLEAIKLARENGVVMMSFPAHTTHRLQPLDVAFFKSLKSWYNIQMEKFLRTSHGQTVSAHQISGFVGAAFLKAASMETAVNGFKKTGLWPPDQHVFDDEFSQMEAAQGKRMEPTQTASKASSPEDPQTPVSESPHTSARGGSQAPVHELPRASSPEDSLNGRSIPTKGDGRCFFRAISITLNRELQLLEREQITGVILNRIKANYETAEADMLRARVVSRMCQDLHTDPGAAELCADMPSSVHFETFGDRILHMSDPQAMVGELEIKYTAKTLGRTIHVEVAGGSFIAKYDEGDASMAPLRVKYFPNADAGHYEAIANATPITPRRRVAISDISPIPKIITGTKRKTSKSHVLTGSPYKDALEKKKTRKESSKTTQGNKDKEKTKKKTCKKAKKTSINKEDENPCCIVCGEYFMESKSREKWITCSMCKQWAHLQCTPNEGAIYICHTCE